jgi:hypothetical protein
VYTQEVNAILLADKLRSKNTTYKDDKKKEIKALAHSLEKDREQLSSRHSEVGRLLGLVSMGNINSL